MALSHDLASCHSYLAHPLATIKSLMKCYPIDVIENNFHQCLNSKVIVVITYIQINGHPNCIKNFGSPGSRQLFYKGMCLCLIDESTAFSGSLFEETCQRRLG